MPLKNCEHSYYLNMEKVIVGWPAVKTPVALSVPPWLMAPQLMPWISMILHMRE